MILIRQTIVCFKFVAFLLLLLYISNVSAQKSQTSTQTSSTNKDNEIFFKKNVAPIFKNSCTCHQGMTNYSLVLPKAKKIWEVVQAPHGKMSTHLKKDYLPIVEYWVKTTNVTN